MGDFNASCAVSNLAIREGDEVFWLYTKKDYINTTYDLGTDLYQQIERCKEQEKFKKKNAEFALRFPEETEPLWGEFWTNREISAIVWGFGEYNGYGWVDSEDDLDDGDRDRLVLIRKDVADKLAAFGATLIDREWYDSKSYLKDSYAYCLVLVCKLTRINLFGHNLLGRQYVDSDEMLEQRFVHKVIGEELRKLDKDVKHRESEYENCSFWVEVGYNLKTIWQRIKNKLKLSGVK